MEPPITWLSSVQFRALDNQGIETSSCGVINSGQTFTPERHPFSGGVVDAHQGTITYDYYCATCFNDKSDCPGHLTHISLRIPTVSPIVAKVVTSYLRIICHNCGKRINKSVTFAKSSASKRKCIHCGYDQPRIRTANPPIYIIILPDKKDGESKKSTKAEAEGGMKWFPHHYRHILEMITPETLEELGVPISAHPKKFVCDNLPLASIVTHPDTRQPGASTRTTHDPVTMMYTNIANLNNKVKSPSSNRVMTSREFIAEATDRQTKGTQADHEREESEWIELLTMIYNCIKDSPESSVDLGFGVIGANGQQNVMQSLLWRFKGKTGFYRGNMLGKPTSYMGRATITGNPTIEIDTIVIPLAFARKLQIRETVQKFNYEKMLYFFQNGLQGSYPGCKIVIKHDTGARIRVKEGSNIANINLEIGDIIYRDMITGDICLFNRMPTLFYASMNKQRVVVSEDPNNMVIGMNELSVTPYNADFDGDEMSIINIQSEAARSQINELSAITGWFHGYKDGTPHYKPIQTTIVLPALATRHGVQFSLRQVMRMFGNTTIIPRFSLDKFNKSEPITGHELISMILPKVNYSAKSNYYDEKFEPYIPYHDDEKQIKVVQGKIVSGVCDKGFSGIFSIINNEYGARAALTTMYNLQQLAAELTTKIGASVCIFDLMVSRETEQEIARDVASLINANNMLSEQLMRNEIIPPVGLTVGQYIERQSLGTLAGDFLNPLMGGLFKRRNGVLNMILYGATGAYVNLKQVRACIGQTVVNNKRIEQRLSYKRSYAYFTRFDTSPAARGFVDHSLMQGMTPSAVCSRSVAARLDLLQKTAMTANTGYQSRISGMNLQSNIIDNGGFCSKEDNGLIVQQAYGDNGFDPRHIEKVSFPTVLISDKEFEEKFNFDPAEFAQLRADRNTYRSTFMRLERYMPKIPMTDSQKLPLNIRRIIDDILSILDTKLRASGGSIFEAGMAENADGTPLHSHALPEHFNTFRWDYDEQRAKASQTVEAQLDAMRQQVRDFINDLPYIFHNPNMAANHGYVGPYRKSSVQLVAMSVRSYLHTGTLRRIQQYGDGQRILAVILKKAWLTLQEHIMDYGAPIGMLTALCISEPVTQLSLNAIHVKDTPGGKSKDDFAQLREILSVRPLAKCVDPIMRIQLVPGVSEERAREIANMLEMMQFSKFVINHQIFYEEFGDPQHPDYVHEKTIIDEFMKYAVIPKPDDLLRYCLRFELDSYMMILKNITVQNIINGIALSTITAATDYYFVYSSENSIDRKLFLRVYLRSTVPNVNTLDELRALKRRLLAITVRGVEGIISASLDSSIVSQTDAEGKISTGKIMMIKTFGVNLPGVFMLQTHIPEIDYRTVHTDNVDATAKFFGIGAARMKVIGELDVILSGIAYCHFTLAADEIVVKGYPTPITPTGPQRRGGNVLLQLGNEKPVQVLEGAIKQGKSAEVNGISSSLMMGQMPKIGSNYNTFIYDTNYETEEDNTIRDMLDAF